MKQPSRWRIAQNCLHLLEEVYLLDRFPPQTTRNEVAITHQPFHKSTVSRSLHRARARSTGPSADPQV